MYFVSIWYHCNLMSHQSCTKSQLEWNCSSEVSLQMFNRNMRSNLCPKKKQTPQHFYKLGRGSQRASSPSDLSLFPWRLPACRNVSYTLKPSHTRRAFTWCALPVRARACFRVISSASSFCMFGTRLGHLKPREVYPGAVLTLSDCLQWFPLLVSMST